MVGASIYLWKETRINVPGIWSTYVPALDSYSKQYDKGKVEVEQIDNTHNDVKSKSNISVIDLYI